MSLRKFQNGDVVVVTEHSQSGRCRVLAKWGNQGNWSCYEDLQIVYEFSDTYEIC
jgi:hypothetical protein